MRVAPSWPRWRRFVLNFGTVYFALYFLVVGQPLVPVLPESVRFALADTFSRTLFRTSLSDPQLTGSSDTAKDWALALLGLLWSLILSVIWTVLRRSEPSQRHLSALSVGLRAVLIFWMCTYGLAKFNFGQFGLLAPGQLSQTYGDSSPMGLLWRFMAASPGYQIVAGVAEVLPALLLLHRRTVRLGALIATVTMTNVFALNMLYDVPVKLFSFHLLLAATVLAAFDHAQLLALLTGRAVPAREWPPRPRWIGWAGWAVTVLGMSYVGLTAVHGLETLRWDQAGTRVSPAPLKTRGFHWVSEYPYWR